MLIATDVRNPVGAGRVRLVLPPSRHRRAVHSRAVLLDPCLPAQHHLARRWSPELDLKSAELSQDQEAAAALALVGDGLFAAGRIVSTDEGGRVFRASRIYLRGRQPRA